MGSCLDTDIGSMLPGTSRRDSDSKMFSGRSVLLCAPNYN